MFRRERTIKTIPSMNTITSALRYACSWLIPVSPEIFATTSAKKLFKPIPGAMANGLFAANAMKNIPIAEAIHVARKTAFQSGLPTSNPVSRFGFNAIM